MRLHFEPRPAPSFAMQVLAPVVALGLTVAVGCVLFALLDLDPIETLRIFFVRPLSSANGVSEWLLKASPLILIGLGLAVGFRANVWNIGAEGMFVIGAICACGPALAFGEGDHVWLLPLMALAGAAGGIAWAAAPAFLRVRFNANEILVTLMLNYVAILLLGWLVRGPWRDPYGFNYPQTAIFGPSALFDPLVGGYRVNTSIFITLVAVAAAWVFIQWSFAGYRMTVGGAAPAAARFAGFRESRAIWMGLLTRRRLRRPRGHDGGGGSPRAAIAHHLAGLRIRRDHRGVHRPPASLRDRARRAPPLAPVHGRRIGTDHAQASGRADPHVPGHAALLPAGGRTS